MLRILLDTREFSPPFPHTSYRSQPLDVLVRRPEGGHANLLRKLGKLRVGQHRQVAQEVVDHIAVRRWTTA